MSTCSPICGRLGFGVETIQLGMGSPSSVLMPERAAQAGAAAAAAAAVAAASGAWLLLLLLLLAAVAALLMHCTCTVSCKATSTKSECYRKVMNGFG
jgi:hypothetical protein